MGLSSTERSRLWRARLDAKRVQARLDGWEPTAPPPPLFPDAPAVVDALTPAPVEPAAPAPAAPVDHGPAPVDRAALGDALADWVTQTLRVPAGHDLEGQPFEIEDWQREFFREALAPGVSEAALVTARKNGKTAVAAALALGHLAGPGFRVGWRAAVCSLSKDKARELVDALKAIMRASAIPEGIDIEVRVTPYPGRITRLRGPADGAPDMADGREASEHMAHIEVLSADKSAGHAGGYDLVLVDETGLMEERHRALLEGLRSSVSAKGGLLIHLTIRGNGLFVGELRERAKAIPDSTVVHFYEGRRGAELNDRDNWYAANPGLGSIKLESYMQTRVREVTVTPENETFFRGFDLNEQVDLVDELLLPASLWTAAERAHEADLPPRGGPMYGGVDLGDGNSLSAVAAYWPETNRLELQHAAPAAPTLEEVGRAKACGKLLAQARDKGEIWTLGDVVTDNGALLRDFFGPLREAGEHMRGIGYDRHRPREVEQACLDSGIPPSVMVPRGIGAGDNADGSYAVRMTQSTFRRGRVAVVASKLMLHELSGAVVRRDINWNPAVQRYDGRRSIIDGVSAMVLALALAAADAVWRRKNAGRTAPDQERRCVA